MANSCIKFWRGQERRDFLLDNMKCISGTKIVWILITGTLTAKMDIKILNAVKHEGAQIDTVKALMVKSDDINQPWTIRSINLPVNVEWSCTKMGFGLIPLRNWKLEARTSGGNGHWYRKNDDAAIETVTKRVHRPEKTKHILYFIPQVFIFKNKYM